MTDRRPLLCWTVECAAISHQERLIIPYLDLQCQPGYGIGIISAYLAAVSVAQPGLERTEAERPDPTSYVVITTNRAAHGDADTRLIEFLFELGCGTDRGELLIPTIQIGSLWVAILVQYVHCLD